MTFSHPLLKAITGSLLGLGFAAAAHAQTVWDMPTPYPASNFHTENIQQFAKEVDEATGGKLKITVQARRRSAS
jgi:TRAP-type C4-dicarboxylate transport system substrate-binding protein